MCITNMKMFILVIILNNSFIEKKKKKKRPIVAFIVTPRFFIVSWTDVKSDNTKWYNKLIIIII